MRESLRQLHLHRLAIAGPAVALALVSVVVAVPFASETTRTAPAPHFLVATRAMPDSMFAHTVILMLPSVEYPLVSGVILNQPSAVPIRNLFPNSTALKNKDDTAFLGGPVELNQAMMVLRAAQPPPHAVHLFDDIYATLDPDATADALKNPALADYRVFLGRAQWLDDQLHAESVAGAWYVVPAKSDLVFSDPEKLWPTLVQRAEQVEAREINPGYISRAGTFALFPVGVSKL